MIHQIHKPSNLDEYVLMLMNLDNLIRSLKVEQNLNHGAIASQNFHSSAHPSHVSGGLAPMELSALKAHMTLRPPVEDRYMYINRLRKTIAARN